MLSLNKLNHFVMLARTLNYVKAAEQLNLSQPALSRSIQSIEKDYDVVLFDRSSSGVFLTKVGKEILEQSEAILYNSNTLNDYLLKTSRGLAGHVKFGVGPFLLRKLMPRLACEVINQFPAARLSVSSGTDASMREQLLAGALDFYVGQYDQLQGAERISVHHLYAGSSGFFVRPGHPLLSQAEILPQDMEPYARISAAAWNASLPGKVENDVIEYLQASIEIDDAAAAAEVVYETDGILIGRRIEAITGALEVLPLRIDIPPSRIGIITLNDRTLAPLAEAVIQVIRLSSALDD